MHNSQDHPFQWTPYNDSHARPDIKVEAVPEPFSLLSPPSSPSLPLTGSSSLSFRRRSTSSISSPKRVRPYPPLPRETSRSRLDQSEMATTPSLWGSSRSGSSRASDRRGSEGNQHLMYNSPYGSMPIYANTRPSDSSDEHRSPSSGSSGTSSLTGAMGDTHVSARNSGSPPPPRDPIFNMMMGQPVGWQTSMMAPQSAYPGVAGNMAAASYIDSQAPAYSYRGSPESLSPPSPYNESFRPQTSTTYPPTTSGSAYPPVSPQEAEIRRLRKRVRDLEQSQAKAQESGPARRAYPAGTLPSPMSTPPSTASFNASWKARTEARVRQFCALNRAGNALCAWHDSRRERRVYPPRMAPDGYLNCGCTYEEALFEESLARHHVGSYLPGETVRMDPALRNPLLKLLETRYGYKDGDFERDPRTGDWIPGEGPAFWEQQIQAGVPNPRQNRR